MKRFLLHLLFWTVYMVQDTLMSYLWDTAKLQSLPMSQQITMAIGNSFVYLLPKLLFTYFVLYVLLDNILAGKGKLWKNVLYIVFSLFVTLILFRLLARYVTVPLVYHGLLNVPPFFNLLGFLANLMDLGFAAGAAIFIKQLRLQLAGKEQEKILIKEKLETELKFLKNQTNPHFLFNTLNNIYALARKKSDRTPDVVMKLSKMLRFMLYESGKPFITIAEETGLIEDYLDLERIRYNERLNITFKKEIDNSHQQVSPLLLLPFVENAFKHGISETRFDSFVNIELLLKNGVLHFMVENAKENTGVASGDTKIGLCNVKRQLELMYRQFDLQVNDNETSFSVNLTIHLNSHEKI
ncbi:MAG: sensor histidine kinase [Bacteroidota bacterium]